MDRIEKRLELLKEILKNPDVLVSTMEVPFYVFDYDVEDEPVVEYHLERIVAVLPFEVCKAHIFHILVEVLKEAEYISYLFGRGRSEVLENILSFVSDVRDRILKSSNNADIVFITGVGEGYPFLRVSNILNDLEGHLNVPVVVFYPGTFDGVKFLLFRRLEDGVYYRAKPIIEREWGDPR